MRCFLIHVISVHWWIEPYIELDIDIQYLKSGGQFYEHFWCNSVDPTWFNPWLKRVRWKLFICLKSCAQKLQLGLREKSYILLLGLVPLSLFLNCSSVTLLYLYEFFFLFPFVRWFFFQWMVVNYKQFVPNQPLAPETFWVLEQLRGNVMMVDMSEILDNDRYWASYNLPLVWFTLWLVPPPPSPRQKH